MKSKIIFLIITFAPLFLFIIGCAPQMSQLNDLHKDVPLWTHSRQINSYPDSLFLIGVGMANFTADGVQDKKQAEVEAFAQIARQIKSEIRSKDVHFTIEKSSTKGDYSMDSTSSISEIYSKVMLQGLSYIDDYVHHEDSLFYALAVLNRAQATTATHLEIQNLRQHYVSMIQQCDSAYKHQRVLRALWYAKEAGCAQHLSNERLSIAHFIASSFDQHSVHQMSFKPSVLALNKAEMVLANLSFEKIGGDEQYAELDSIPKDPLIAKLSFSLLDNILLPIQGATIRFEFISGNSGLIQQAITDNNGIVSSQITYIQQNTNLVTTVQAALDLDAILGDVKYLPEQWNTLFETYQKQLIYQIHMCAETIESKALLLALKLAEDIPADSPRPFPIAIHHLTYQDENISSSFMDYFQNLLEHKLGRMPEFLVVKRRDVQSMVQNNSSQITTRGLSDSYEWIKNITGSQGILTGKCWDMQDNSISIIIEVLENNSHVALASADISIPKTHEIFSDYDLLPENYESAREQMTIFVDSSFSHLQDNPLKIEVWVDRMQGSVYKEEEKIQSYVRANKDCYVKLIYHDVAGHDILIFPNTHQSYTRIRGEVTYPVPGPGDKFDFTVVSPCGVELLKAVASTWPLPDLPGQVQANSGIKPISVNTNKLMMTLRSIAVTSSTMTSDEACEHAEASCVVTTVRN